jgi:putative membrane protein
MMYGFGRFAAGHALPWLSWVGPIAMAVCWALFIAGIVILIVYLARRSRSTGGGTALEILKERYARGEIAREEFDQKRKDLQG